MPAKMAIVRQLGSRFLLGIKSFCSIQQYRCYPVFSCNSVFSCTHRYQSSILYRSSILHQSDILYSSSILYTRRTDFVVVLDTLAFLQCQVSIHVKYLYTHLIATDDAFSVHCHNIMPYPCHHDHYNLPSSGIHTHELCSVRERSSTFINDPSVKK